MPPFIAAERIGEAASEAVRSSAEPDGLSVPQGLSEEQFVRLSARVREGAERFGSDIRIHGSRAAGVARPDSDIDIAIRVSPQRFDEIVHQQFGTPNPGSAAERTMQHAIRTGKIQAAEAGLRPLRISLEAEHGMRVHISVIREDGPFDQGPWIPLR